jgi:ABC-type lipoprotein release transport system permease subunit
MTGRLMRMGWRNVLRNRRRTLITGTAIGIGLASMIFMDSLVLGWSEQIVLSATDNWLGDAQIHREGFRETGNVELTLQRPVSIEGILSGSPEVRAFTFRVESPATLQSAYEFRSVSLTGVDPGREAGVSMLEAATDSGDYFAGDSTDLIIGRKLAGDLDAGLGDIIVITVATVDGGLSQNMFRICGICSFGSDDLDRYSAFIRIDAARNMLGIGGGSHEIAIRLEDYEAGMNDTLAIWREWSVFGNEATGWPELLPSLKALLGMTDLSKAIFALILFGIVVFIIVNTLFMSIYERLFEFGVLRAVGTRASAVGWMVLFESASLGLISVLIGSLIGFLVTWLFSVIGIDFTGVEISGILMNRPTYTILRMYQFILYPVGMLLFTVIAGIYPAVHASRLVPADAMRKSF